MTHYELVVPAEKVERQLAMKKPKQPTHAFMLRRLAKHLQITKEEVVEEAVKEMYAFNFNE